MCYAPPTTWPASRRARPSPSTPTSPCGWRSGSAGLASVTAGGVLSPDVDQFKAVAGAGSVAAG
jgi:hypothetical protein